MKSVFAVDLSSWVAIWFSSCVDLGRQQAKALPRRWYYRGKTYYLTIRVTPNFDRVRDFAAVLYFTRNDDTERKVQIARIDTTHGYTHFDRLYRRDQPKERIDATV